MHSTNEMLSTGISSLRIFFLLIRIFMRSWLILVSPRSLEKNHLPQRFVARQATWPRKFLPSLGTASIPRPSMCGRWAWYFIFAFVASLLSRTSCTRATFPILSPIRLRAVGLTTHPPTGIQSETLHVSLPYVALYLFHFLSDC
jgi:hypothetical protein